MKAGSVYDFYSLHAPKDGLTVSTSLLGNEECKMTYFSLGKGTDISRESYSHPSFYLCLGGRMELLEEKEIPFSSGNIYFHRENRLLGMRSLEGAGYIEVLYRKENARMNEKVKAGEVLKLSGLVDYEEDSIVNMDVVSNEKMKFVLMAFDEGQALSAHRAPGDAIIFALEGEGVISYEGKDYTLKAGEQFRFAKNGLHAVKATKRFKMALLLVL